MVEASHPVECALPSARTLARQLVYEASTFHARWLAGEVPLFRVAAEEARPAWLRAEALRRAGRPVEAEHHYREVLRLMPAYAPAHDALGVVLYQQGRLADALRACRRASKGAPALASAWANAAGPLLTLGSLNEAIDSYERALRLDPNLEDGYGLLLALQYSPWHGPAEHYEASRRYAARLDHLPPLPLRGRDRNPERRLRVGYVSPDLRQHPVASFFEPVLRAHNRARVHITCYADVERPDAVTERLRGLSDDWRDARGLSDDDLAGAIRRDQIDVLVDLAGHTRGHRLPVFARRPAPVQVTYLGYPGTTGLRAMDARLTDIFADPIGTEGHYSEELVRLAPGFLCYGPPDDAPDVDPLALAERPLTFVSFNNRPKITAQVLRCWAKILLAVPEAWLLIKAAGLSDPAAHERLLDELDALGVEPGRVTLSGFVPSQRDHLGLYRVGDIALDTFPYNGTTTTCEALWMGLPVVTLRSDRHAGRVGTSILERVGLPELIADTEADYVARAVALAQDRPRLIELRAGMRDRLRASSLLDARGVTAAIEGAYRDLWRRL